MTYDDRVWMARTKDLLAPLWRLVQPPGQRIRIGWRLSVYVWALRAHRWLWVRGVCL